MVNNQGWIQVTEGRTFLTQGTHSMPSQNPARVGRWNWWKLYCCMSIRKMNLNVYMSIKRKPPNKVVKSVVQPRPGSLILVKGCNS